MHTISSVHYFQEDRTNQVLDGKQIPCSGLRVVRNGFETSERVGVGEDKWSYAYGGGCGGGACAPSRTEERALDRPLLVDTCGGP